ncbi:putative tRNA 2'-phosphotransferase 1 [Triangularia setosa]|uniref:2'-phosphotransferase n=1 Tax=Triangularia setosa TaxID=2587417 RepID=A0AAN7AB91_9PEZI|nr:putative tRNA 2'-phosphotransferase 1 [Podospora setosa]
MDKAGLIADQFDAQTSSSTSSKRGGRSGGGRGGGRPGGGRAVDLSRALSRLLRHQASNAGIDLDKEGYAPLDKVLSWGPVKSLKPSFEEIVSAVRDSDKQRFALKLVGDKVDETSTDPRDWLIRANQGHSIPLSSETLLKPLAVTADPSRGELPIPEVVVHGTYFAFWPLIKESGGLKRMGRNHVHFSTGLPEDDDSVVSGMRKDAELLVYVDVAKAIKDGGLTFWMSENGVVLTEGDQEGKVGLEYFKEVVGRKRELVGVIWQDGEAVEGGELPGGLKIRQPHGKGGNGGRGGRGGKRGGRERG